MKRTGKIILFNMLIVIIVIFLPMSVRAENTYTEGNYTYRLVEEGAVITKYNGTETDITVPATIGGYPVIGLGQGTFRYNTSVKTITLSEGIKYLSPEMISDCSVESIHLPTTMGQNVGGSFRGIGGTIYGNKNLREITVAEGNEFLTVYEGVLYSKDMRILFCCPPANPIETLVIPDGVETIADDSCRDNKNVKEIIMPDTVTYIGYWAFIHDSSLEKLNISQNCKTIGQFAIENTAITTLHIPASVTMIASSAINNNRNLKTITVDENNQVYHSSGGALCTETSVVAYPIGNDVEAYVIEDGISSIMMSAFHGASNLKYVTLPATMESIDYYAFFNCVNLEKINLPNGITKIGSHVFANDNKLTHIVLPESLEEVPEGILCNAQCVTIQANVKSINEQSYFNHLQQIYFSGDAPQDLENIVLIGTERAFTIYYPEGNETWAEPVSQYSGGNITWKSHTHSIGSEWITDWPATNERAGRESQQCTVCGAVCNTREIDALKDDDTDNVVNGLVQAEDGGWYYCVNGAVNAEYTGLVYDENVGWWYVENGKINFAYNGLIFYNDAWWCVAGGQVRFDYAGLWCDPYVGWWYVENGAVNFGYNGLIYYNDAWWCVAGGQVCFDYTGLWYDPYVGWWYVENGVVNFGYNGLIYYNGAWWCVAGGQVCFDYTGLWYDVNVGWWYVNGGTIDFGYTGLVYDANVGWWYVENGAINFDYTGLCTYNGATYQVVNGAML